MQVSVRNPLYNYAFMFLHMSSICSAFYSALLYRYRYRYRGLGKSLIFKPPRYLHTNFLTSCILIRYRFTNKRRSSTIQTINLPKLAGL